MMALSPITVLADDTELEARVVALEERVASLEAQLNIQEVAEMESEEATEKAFDLYFEDEDCILSYDGYETVHDTQGKPAIITYFYFTNNSDETKTAMAAFSVKVFQHGKEMSPAYISQHIQEESDSFAQVMPGADPIRVAFVSKLDDMSDVIVRVGPLFDFGGDKHLDIPLTVKSGKEPEEKTEKKPEESRKSDESAPPFDDLHITAPETETTAEETEAPESNDIDFDNMYRIDSNGCTMYYEKSEIDADPYGKPCIYVYGYFVNNSSSRQTASTAFRFDAYQDGIELKEMFYSVNEAYKNHSTFILPGADPLYVAFGFELRDTVSDVILTINPMFSLSKEDAFSMTLTMPKE
jgi:hypothetical protein